VAGRDFATIFMVVAVAAFNGGHEPKFVVVLDIAISTTLISYLWVFPASSSCATRTATSTVRTASRASKRGMWVAAG
jgi:hypothetical protein